MFIAHADRRVNALSVDNQTFTPDPLDRYDVPWEIGQRLTAFPDWTVCDDQQPIRRVPRQPARRKTNRSTT